MRTVLWSRSYKKKKMSLSVECLRTFVIERLTVAAEDIFRVFQQKIDEYEARVDYQRRLLESVWRPEVKLRRMESQPPFSQEDRVPAHQHQDGSCSLEQEDSEPPPVKEEPQEPWCYQDRETVKQESNTLMETPIHKEDDQSEDPILDSNPDQRDEKSKINTTAETSGSPEPDCGQQLLSNSHHVAESKDQDNYRGGDLGSTPGEDLKPAVKQNRSKRHPGKANSPADSAVDWKTHTGATPATGHTGEEQEKVPSDVTGASPVHANHNPDARSACGKRSTGRRSPVHTRTGPFNCETCGKEFKMSAYLKVHMRIHTGEKPYSCKTCGKAFRTLAELKIHTRVHTGERPYSCKTCGKSFKSRSALKVHMGVHTSEKPFLCKLCGKTFKQQRTVNIHMRLHTGERPHLCSTCGKEFHYIAHLKVHMRSHTGERPFPCKECGKDFLQSSHLKAHMRLHSRDGARVSQTGGPS